MSDEVSVLVGGMNLLVSYSKPGYAIFPLIIGGAMIEIRWQGAPGTDYDSVRVRALTHSGLSDWKPLDRMCISLSQRDAIEKFARQAHGL